MSTHPLAAPLDPPPGVDAVLAALPRGAAVEVRETHISYVFLTGDSAYKLKKPVVLPFLDYGTRERRRLMCQEEVRLNSRLAPSIYRGFLSVVYGPRGFRLESGDYPGALEHVVWMRRFREEHTLAARLDPELITAVAVRLAEFHAEAPVVVDVDPCEQVRASAEETFTTLAELVPRSSLRLIEAGRRFTAAFLRAHGPEMRARARAGRVVDGHGDLRAEHVLMEQGAVEIVDCIEFDPSLRRIDAGADLSFLVMDLERLGAPQLARDLVRAYEAAGGSPGGPDLIAFHAAQRAWVRAKVALLRHDVPEAKRLLELGQRLSWRARQPLLLLVCGLSGAGKTTLAQALGRVSGAAVISSDVVRKQLAGVESREHGGPQLYTPEFSRRTYAELGRVADRELRSEGLAIVDATFRRAADRAAFSAALGRRLGAEARVVECVASREVRLARAAARQVGSTGASDATAAVAAAQSFDTVTEVDPPRHLVVKTDGPAADIAAEIEDWLDDPTTR